MPRCLVSLLCLGMLIGCTDEVVPPDPDPSPSSDYREAVVGVYSGRAFFRRTSFGITVDSMNWASDAIVSLDASDDSSIVISSADTMKLSPDLTFVGPANTPLPMSSFFYLSGYFQVQADTMRLEFTGLRPLFELLDEYVHRGSLN